MSLESTGFVVVAIMALGVGASLFAISSWADFMQAPKERRRRPGGVRGGAARWVNSSLPPR